MALFQKCADQVAHFEIHPRSNSEFLIAAKIHTIK